MKDKPYIEVLKRLAEIVNFLGQRTVVADPTGLGAPFIDFLRASTLRLRNDAPNRPPCEIPERENQYRQHGYLLPVTITASGTAGSTTKGGYNVPKVDLIETLDRMLEAGRLEISTDLAEAETLKGELLSLRRNGNSYEPHSSLVHDDLLMAHSPPGASAATGKTSFNHHQTSTRARADIEGTRTGAGRGQAGAGKIRHTIRLDSSTARCANILAS